MAVITAAQQEVLDRQREQRARNTPARAGTSEAWEQHEQRQQEARDAAEARRQQPYAVSPDGRPILNPSGPAPQWNTSDPRVQPTGVYLNRLRAPEQAVQFAGAQGAGLNAAANTQQQALNNYLMGQALGRGGPSAAGAAFQQNLDRNIAAQRAMAAGVRGGGAAAAARAGAQAGVQLGLAGQAQAAALRAQEQQAAQQLFAQNLSTTRGQNMDYGRYLLGAQQAPNDLWLRAAETMGNFIIGRRNADTNRQLANQQKTGMYLDFAGDVVGAVGGGVGGALGGGGGKG